MKKSVIFVALAALSATLQANEIELSVSDELIDVRLVSEYEQGFSGTFAYLHAGYKESDSDQLSYTFATKGKIDRFDASLGARIFWLDVEGGDVYGVALGAGGAVDIIDKLSVSAEAYFAPDIITGGDFEHTLDASVRLNYQLIENGNLFVGYRVFEADDKVDVDVYDNPYVGVRFTF